jgi:muramoyltetrapeptide carboxypeptidase
LFAGGGYGAMRVIDRVDFSPLSSQPKWFVGYSDATAIFSRLSKMGIAAIHATMAFQFGQDELATESVRQLLVGERVEYKIQTNALNRIGMARSTVVGGNLSLLYALSGSRDDLETKGKILFLEDLDEQLYHLDRMMLQLKRSGKLSQLAGLLVGGMSDMKDNAVPYGMNAEEIIVDAVKEYEYPVCFGFPAGHIKNNLALYLGKKAALTITTTSSTFSY